MKQVLSIEQAKHLRELGIVMNDTILCWCENLQDGTQELQINNSAAYSRSWIKATPTFTLDEVLSLLPDNIDNAFLHVDKKTVSYEIMVSYSYDGDLISFVDSENIINAAYEMLCWCIVNGYIKTK